MSAIDMSERQFKYRLWRVNINGQVIEGRWRNALGAINGAAARLFGSGPLAPEHDFDDLAVHIECIGRPVPRPKPPQVACQHCDAGEPSVWDSELEWYAHPDGDKLKTCAHPWRNRGVHGPDTVKDSIEQAAIDSWGGSL